MMVAAVIMVVVVVVVHAHLCDLPHARPTMSCICLVMMVVATISQLVDVQVTALSQVSYVAVFNRDLPECTTTG